MFAPAPLPRNLEASFRDLESQKPATRASAVRDVVRHALRSDETRARAIRSLEKLLKGDRVPGVRAEAAVALADVSASEALPSLLVAVEDDDAHVRQMALAALGEIGDARASQRLERALRDDRPEVRYQAVIAYARVARDDAAGVTSALLRALDDDDAAIRYIAMRMAEEQLAAAGAGADSGAGASPDAGADAMADQRLLSRARQLVEKGEAEGDGATAVVAGLYLARAGEARGREVVLEVVAESRETPEIEDEQACVELAGELGMREAIEHLERRAWGRRRVLRELFSWGAGDRASCAWHSRIALARMGHERARAEILADLSSWRRETREAAVVAAGRARIGEARGALENLQQEGGTVDAALVREALVRLAVE